MLAGIPGATGRAALHTTRVRRLADHLSAVAAGRDRRGRRQPRAVQPGGCRRGDDLLAAELVRIRELAGPEAEPRAFKRLCRSGLRVTCIAHVRRTLRALDEAVERAFTGVTDSPAYLDGEFVGTAGFHGIDLAAHCDHLTAALAHAAEVSTARLHRLLDP